MLRRSAVGATAVNLDAGHVTVLDRGTGSEYDEPFDFHLLATGAQAVRPDLPGSQAPNVFVLRHYDDGVAIAAFLRDQRPRHVTIVGGGYIGLELAEAFRAGRGIDKNLLWIKGTSRRWDGHTYFAKDPSPVLGWFNSHMS